jgi:hypothetical protein
MVILSPSLRDSTSGYMISKDKKIFKHMLPCTKSALTPCTLVVLLHTRKAHQRFLIRYEGALPWL